MSVPVNTVFVALTATGGHLAERLAANLPGTEVHGLVDRVSKPDVAFDATAKHLRALFAAGRPIVGVCAAGILIRTLAPLLNAKHAEPAVVAMAEDGSVAVPLLGGHHGANTLARTLAAVTGGHAALTTAGDIGLGITLDNPPPGWRITNSPRTKGVAAALLAGDPVSLCVEAGNAAWLTASGLSFQCGTDGILITDRAITAEGSQLIFHPPVLVLGIGCERGVDAKEVIDLVEKTLTDAGLSSDAVACVASVDVKADEAALHAVAAHLAVPARFFPPARLEAETPRLANPSDIVFAEVGCHGVAEASALAAVGRDGFLVVEKQKSRRATCAIGRSVAPLDPTKVGVKRGYLSIVGIGPGSPAWRAPAATQALADADEVVGYHLYLDLVDDLITGKPRHDSALSEEETRVRIALDKAAEGKNVALVCSGDAGIYALATLTFELLDRENRADWNRLEIRVEPGVSAIQAAAARVGAPIGHDFCAISLSDLLTPWEEIVKRLEAAAVGDFVVALYNPVSSRRRTQLKTAQKILVAARPVDTPVVLARNLGREDESVDIITLGELKPDHADMLTIILIGNSQTRLTKRGESCWVYTPRGYAAKMA